MDLVFRDAAYEAWAKRLTKANAEKLGALHVELLYAGVGKGTVCPSFVAWNEAVRQLQAAGMEANEEPSVSVARPDRISMRKPAPAVKTKKSKPLPPPPEEIPTIDDLLDEIPDMDELLADHDTQT